MTDQPKLPQPGRWQKFRGFFIGGHVAAKESMVRDMLALERTYLGAQGSSSARLTCPSVDTHFFGDAKFDDWLASASTHRKTDRLLSARDLGTAFVTSSPLICGYVTWRYYRALGLLKGGKFPEAKGGVMLMSIAVAAATLSATQLAPGSLFRRGRNEEHTEEVPTNKN